MLRSAARRFRLSLTETATIPAFSANQPWRIDLQVFASNFKLAATAIQSYATPVAADAQVAFEFCAAVDASLPPPLHDLQRIHERRPSVWDRPRSPATLRTGGEQQVLRGSLQVTVCTATTGWSRPSPPSMVPCRCCAIENRESTGEREGRCGEYRRRRKCQQQAVGTIAQDRAGKR
jgi:hypothetical protein